MPPRQKKKRPAEDQTPSIIDELMRSRTDPAFMEKLRDRDGHEIATFHPLGAQAVAQIYKSATAGGNSGGNSVLNKTTNTYVWLQTVDASSHVDSKCVVYALEEGKHALPVIKKYSSIAFASLRSQLRPKVLIAVLIGRSQTRAGGARLAIVQAWAKATPDVEVLEGLFYRDDPVNEKSPYEVGPRHAHQLARPPLVDLVELAKCLGASLVIFDIFRRSGGKGAAARGVLTTAIAAIPGADIDVRFAVAAQSVSATLKIAPDSRLLADIRSAMAVAVAQELAEDGPTLGASGALGACIYLVDGPDGVVIVYGGSHQAYAEPWAELGEDLIAAVDGNVASEAVSLADELVESRGSGHDSKGRHGKSPRKLQAMYDQCKDAKQGYRVRNFIRALAFIRSFAGETKAEFYQRLLRLEQGLLDVLFCLFRSAQRRRYTRGRALTRSCSVTQADS